MRDSISIFNTLVTQLSAEFLESERGKIYLSCINETAIVASDCGFVFTARPMNIAPLGFHSVIFSAPDASSEWRSQTTIVDQIPFETVKSQLPPGRNLISSIHVLGLAVNSSVCRGFGEDNFHFLPRRNDCFTACSSSESAVVSKLMFGKGNPRDSTSSQAFRHTIRKVDMWCRVLHV